MVNYQKTEREYNCFTSEKVLFLTITLQKLNKTEHKSNFWLTERISNSLFRYNKKENVMLKYYIANILLLLCAQQIDLSQDSIFSFCICRMHKKVCWPYSSR